MSTQKSTDDNSIVFYSMTRNEGEEVRLRLSEYKGHYYIDLRHWFQPEPQKEYVATKRGVSIPAECLGELLGGFEKLHQAVLKANEGVSREKKATSSFQTRRSPQAWVSR